MDTSGSFLCFIVRPFGGRLQNSKKKNIFVSDSNLGADWCEDVENQKKTNVFGFWFSTSRLDRPKGAFDEALPAGSPTFWAIMCPEYQIILFFG